jgi:hypothetical protein
MQSANAERIATEIYDAIHDNVAIKAMSTISATSWRLPCAI